MRDFPRIPVTSQDSRIEGSLEISCETCIMRASAACDDCVVSFFCNESSKSAVVLNLEEQRTLRMLANAGMVPTLRHRAVS
ncbi:MAG: hypothetical protein RLZ17_450 [Actinomycetota bacterium]